MKKNSTIRLTKIFYIEMAHALLHYDGDCKNIHGHSYRLEVTVTGQPLQQEGHPKNGMLMDFKDLKRIVNQQVVDIYDHALVLNEKTAPDVVKVLRSAYGKIKLECFQPTCENLIISFAESISEKLQENIKLHSLKLYETTTSYAEWVAEENGV